MAFVKCRPQDSEKMHPALQKWKIWWFRQHFLVNGRGQPSYNLMELDHCMWHAKEHSNEQLWATGCWLNTSQIHFKIPERIESRKLEIRLRLPRTNSCSWAVSSMSKSLADWHLSLEYPLRNFYTRVFIVLSSWTNRCKNMQKRLWSCFGFPKYTSPCLHKTMNRCLSDIMLPGQK